MSAVFPELIRQNSLDQLHRLLRLCLNVCAVRQKGLCLGIRKICIKLHGQIQFTVAVVCHLIVQRLGRILCCLSRHNDFCIGKSNIDSFVGHLCQRRSRFADHIKLPERLGCRQGIQILHALLQPARCFQQLFLRGGVHIKIQRIRHFHRERISAVGVDALIPRNRKRLAGRVVHNDLCADRHPNIVVGVREIIRGHGFRIRVHGDQPDTVRRNCIPAGILRQQSRAQELLFSTRQVIVPSHQGAVRDLYGRFCSLRPWCQSHCDV